MVRFPTRKKKHGLKPEVDQVIRADTEAPSSEVLQSAKSALEALRGARLQLDRDSDELESKRRRLTADREELERKRHKLEEARTTFESEQTGFQQEKHQTEEQLDSRRTELDGKLAEVERRSQELARREEELNLQQQLKEQERASCASVIEALNGREQALKKREEAVKKLERRMKKQVSPPESEMVSSVPAASLPAPKPAGASTAAQFRKLRRDAKRKAIGI